MQRPLRASATRDLVASLLLLGLVHGTAAGQGGRPPAQAKRTIVLMGGTVHLPGGKVSKLATIVISAESGLFTYVSGDDGGGLGYTGDDRQRVEEIDCRGKHIWPAMIAANSLVGLTETESVRATLDFDETGDLTPEVRADTAFHPDSSLIAVTRSAGIGYVLSVPQGGLVPGRSALMSLDGWTTKDMVVRAPLALHLRLPSTIVREGRGPDAAKKAAEARAARDRRVQAFVDLIEAARAYAALPRDEPPGQGATRLDTRLEALREVVAGRMPVFVHADALADIQVGLDLTRRLGLRMVLCGGYDAMLVKGELLARGIPVVVSNVHRLPLYRHDPYDAPFTLPARLHAAGIRFCIAGNGGAFEAAHERNLPLEAATAVAHGLDPAAAMAAVTSSVAEILGVADQVGSIREGMRASLIVCDGNPLEVTTKVERMWIDGLEVDLDNRQEALRRRFEAKPRRR